MNLLRAAFYIVRLIQMIRAELRRGKKRSGKVRERVLRDETGRAIGRETGDGSEDF